MFHEPLPAVLAAIRLQKSLRRFNRYRRKTPGSSSASEYTAAKWCARSRESPGQHGEHRLPAGNLLPAGSVLVSEQVHEKVKDYVHAREIGRITVKNISEPIRV